MTLQNFLTPLADHLYFAVFSALTGFAYVLVWVISLKGLIRPKPEDSAYYSQERREKEMVSGVKGSNPMSQRRLESSSKAALRRKLHERRKARMSRVTTKAA